MGRCAIRSRVVGSRRVAIWVWISSASLAIVASVHLASAAPPVLQQLDHREDAAEVQVEGRLQARQDHREEARQSGGGGSARSPLRRASREAQFQDARPAKFEAAVKAAGGSVTINAEKPRKGCFEVKVGDKTIVSLLDMPRPFGPLKALDMDDLAAKVTAAL